jgi:hypothetical protein
MRLIELQDLRALVVDPGDCVEHRHRCLPAEIRWL